MNNEQQYEQYPSFIYPQKKHTEHMAIFYLKKKKKTVKGQRHKIMPGL